MRTVFVYRPAPLLTVLSFLPSQGRSFLAYGAVSNDQLAGRSFLAYGAVSNDRSQLSFLAYGTVSYDSTKVLPFSNDSS